MASEVLKDFQEQVMNTQFSQILYQTARHGDNIPPAVIPSSETFTRSKSKESSGSHTSVHRDDRISTSSYTLAMDPSQYSNDVDRWMGNVTPTISAGVQGSRVPVAQHSTLAGTTTLDTNGIWYFVAMFLPLFSVNNCTVWRCSPSTLMNGAEAVLSHVVRFCNETRAHLRRLAHDHVARDLFATAMDIVLVIYAIGFLVLSLYQASIIG